MPRPSRPLLLHLQRNKRNPFQSRLQFPNLLPRQPRQLQHRHKWATRSGSSNSPPSQLPVQGTRWVPSNCRQAGHQRPPPLPDSVRISIGVATIKAGAASKINVQVVREVEASSNRIIAINPAVIAAVQPSKTRVETREGRQPIYRPNLLLRTTPFRLPSSRRSWFENWLSKSNANLSN